MSIADYIRLQKTAYEEDVPPELIVGNYEWHERFPYETQLLHRNGDLRHPLIAPLDQLKGRTALDFGCGPGRMVRRMANYFGRVDGVDLSARLLDEARRHCPGSRFYQSNGDDIGDVPPASYDFVYSTIAMQHIPVRTIRNRILERLAAALKPGGVMCVQLAFHPDYPFIYQTRRLTILGRRRVVVLAADRIHADWAADKVDAKGTNSACDACIGLGNLPLVTEDFGRHLTDVAHWFYDIRLVAENLDGAKHAPYWPTHWIFVSGVRAG